MAVREHVFAVNGDARFLLPKSPFSVTNRGLMPQKPNYLAPLAHRVSSPGMPVLRQNEHDALGEGSCKASSYRLFRTSIPALARVVRCECLERCNQVGQCHGFCLRTPLI